LEIKLLYDLGGPPITIREFFLRIPSSTIESVSGVRGWFRS